MRAHPALARRPMGTDSGTFSRGTTSRTVVPAASRCLLEPSWRRCCGFSIPAHSGTCSRMLSQLQDRASPVPAVMCTRNSARHSHAVGEHVARGRRDGRTRELHRCDIGHGEGRRRRHRPHSPGQSVKILAIVDRHGLPPLSVRTRRIIMKSRWSNSVSTSTCWRPSPSI